MLDFWTKTSGTWINILAIACGTSLGLILHGRFLAQVLPILKQAIGLITMFVSINMANSLLKVKAGALDGVILSLIALVIGGVIGELIQIEKHLENIGDWLKAKFKGKGKFTEGFVAASLLFCIGPMAIIGSLNNGLIGDNNLLALKSALDGFISIVFASTYGIGVGFSALPVGLYQGIMSVLAGSLAQSLPDPANAQPVLIITGVGGLMLLGLGLNLLELAKVRVASFLPALAIAPLVYWLANNIK
ncbi:MAG: DUF554 domain-containing protein [Pseudanabaena sp. M090S1SP1A06QC]|jgi:uncharacterized membrane protein YqgA involved in biofilm formation|uniref:DUF554 domain-containing protein n=1 Tax=Pseudanabaena mucicola TaxID=71190 RepID=UPI0025778893|nr:DUF554 domain-containing protein [Pseudanabaena mucicola]MCA6574604.1 DUF554 domain-containing protein [Pseudanabaena sp. M53BS1SP1A06MG]MCA6580712.1 DUF554 domain-containing protein [Pseudanabaena sp. M34BS1SP1A06MG]MCA6589331.1 DUF554 domain-containing protein [Pseudanabaena sp. M109S1SP1A06QC]MCA6590673.1 DUF554 domain-containing protein [Pseudanabaena sp. M38BS1SP1A06MG]MCA6598489.1 DUF554 domain-containing protein [Pseudanabaena sp. M046S1SP1A06QC]MCA6600673.1 DUF554 domain-containing